MSSQENVNYDASLWWSRGNNLSQDSCEDHKSKQKMFANGKRIRMQLHFPKGYSCRKRVSIWVRLGKEDKMKIVVIVVLWVTLFNQNSCFCYLKREGSQFTWWKALLQSVWIKTWLLLWSITGGTWSALSVTLSQEGRCVAQDIL